MFRTTDEPSGFQIFHRAVSLLIFLAIGVTIYKVVTNVPCPHYQKTQRDVAHIMSVEDANARALEAAHAVAETESVLARPSFDWLWRKQMAIHGFETYCIDCGRVLCPVIGYE